MKKFLFLVLCISVSGCAGMKQKYDQKMSAGNDRIQKLYPECKNASARLAMSEPAYPDTPDDIVTYRKPPKYPRKLLNAGVEGCTVVQYEITKEGLAENFKIAYTTDTGFAVTSLEALMKWRFKPQENRKRSVMITYALNPPPVP